MRKIANRYIEQAAQPARPLSRATLLAWITGAASIVLYVLLYKYSDTIIDLARATLRGDKELFFIPILIALAFSFIHGAFTGHFWDALGLKAKT